MTVITIDEKLINEVIAVSHYDNAQEAVIKILRNYLHQQKKRTLFERLRFADEYADDDIALLFERDKDTGRDFDL
jgi:Arc/MetJ family transcription regulator